ncbi:MULTISPECIES: cellulase family glycosylhydrolase [unclassified Beijerinckia]|uniref:glycoside hydrolase family 5 protein n=1 Tax=unclassified Beijerinckia TaxID=2638183 RepID=UPI00089C29BE|nr:MULTISPECIES: cellulase family glycosylhydrolase [unclassified Beijerinckia]MDH7794172.1 endoglucanase [Beijerinckia sp. GAS462]SEB54924.1 Cellulase (glycosyl hydrolase family 5) [Beijerinckia sp. 28-YEA-48]
MRNKKLLSRRIVLASAAGAACVAALPLIGAGPPLAASPAPRLRRGGSIHTMMNWADVEPGDPQRYAWPPFSTPHFNIGAGLLRAYRQCGLDHIRMTIDSGPFLQADPEQLKQANQILLERCRQILAEDLQVVVDFHPTQQVERFGPERIVANETGALFKAYVVVLASVAEAMKELDPTRVALELMNEPPYGYDGFTAARWRRMLSAMHRAIRQVNPALPLVISGAAGGGIPGLLSLQPSDFNDPNLFWSFHYYDPHVFTHQGVVTSQSNMLYFRYLSGLAWPADRTNVQAVTTLIAAKIDVDPRPPIADRERLKQEAFDAVEQYEKSKFSEDRIRADFGKVEAWARDNGIASERIYLGEFGIMRETPEQPGAKSHDREAWMRAIRASAERRGFGWALWDINDTQMGLVEQRNRLPLHDGTLSALGLSSRPPRQTTP